MECNPIETMSLLFRNNDQYHMGAMSKRKTDIKLFKLSVRIVKILASVFQSNLKCLRVKFCFSNKKLTLGCCKFHRLLTDLFMGRSLVIDCSKFFSSNESPRISP